MASHRLAVTALTALALTASTAVYARADASRSAKEQERMAGWASKLGLNAQQQERIHNIRGEFSEKADPVEEQLWKLHHDEFDAMKGVLTQEQRDKLPAAIKSEMGRECRTMADKLNLSEDQKQRVEKIREEYEPKFRECCSQSTDSARKQVKQLKSDFFEDMRRVLNDDQRAKFWGVLRQEFRQWRDPVARHERLEELAGQLGVTPEQKAQIQKIRSEYQPGIEKLASQEKEIWHNERAEFEKVLTDEQRTKAHEMWKDFREAAGGKNP